jgi:alkanesulfonate monooxygenase SsuD/methylene tetrahydromethanopterin reductase-like flavin-dependent oxidoreductase (luciferase family)
VRARWDYRWPWRSSADCRSASGPSSTSIARRPRAGHDPSALKLSINSHGFIADTSQAAADQFFEPMKAVMDRIGAERGWPPHTRAQYDAAIQLRGHLFVGSPQQIVDKILFQHEIFGHDRFLLQSTGVIPHAQMMRSIELFGTKVAPAVRAEVSARSG